MTKLNTKPEAIEVDFAKSALVIVDMQNAFASKGGTLDLAGADLSDAPRVVRTIGGVLDAARSADLTVVHLQVGYKPDLSDAGGPRSPNYYKETAMHLMCTRPDLKGKLLTEGSWDFALVHELKPQPGEIVITKTRYSGFAGTTLDAQLRVRGIQYLFFAGIAANVCVESTLRDSYFLDYWPILLADGTMAAGGQKMYEATLFNVESFFGWTIQSGDLRASLTARA
ncbi:MAG TPA: isochorismatase family cysteine hydrolase [Candidatus Acidoferrum sp.]|nr:isochorismatase family cysteine hydrolase [Candidatus Acidoferrum sp.]